MERATNRAASEVVVALGSNLGDRRLHLRRALEALRDVMNVVRVSAVYETEPLDSPRGSGPYLNLVVAGTTRLGAHALLRRLLDIEKQLGRRRRGVNSPRTIDLDLIVFDGLVVRDGDLVLPHPRFHERNFVLVPLAELIPTMFVARAGANVLRVRGRGRVSRKGLLY
jgi:2-amino-4-hydroxy-6-hydroxymethyldihydropteridine diphosphokinase